MPSPPIVRYPLRGEIWFAQLHVDPLVKGRRPVVIVSLDARNRHERADTVLVVPLTTSIHKDFPTHVFLSAGEPGLQADCAARAEDITVVRKQSLVEPLDATLEEVGFGRHGANPAAPPADSPTGPQAIDPGGTLFDAIRKLGLQLRPAKKRVDAIVIDRIEKPTAN